MLRKTDYVIDREALLNADLLQPATGLLHPEAMRLGLEWQKGAIIRAPFALQASRKGLAQDFC